MNAATRQPVQPVPGKVRRCGGFSLVTALMVLAAVALLAVALFTAVRYETGAAGAHERAFRAELALDSALAEAAGQLATLAARDDYLVFEKRLSETERVTVLALPDSDERWEFHELRSLPDERRAPQRAALPADLEIDPLDGESAGPATPPWIRDARAAMVAMPGAENPGPLEVRYTYWIEDLGGQLDLAVAGNQAGEGGVHGRSRGLGAPGGEPAPGGGGEAGAAEDGGETTPPAPASASLAYDVPGHRSGASRPLDRQALFTLDPAARTLDRDPGGTLARTVLEARGWLPTAGTAAALLGADGRRGPDGRQTDERARAIEEHTTLGRRPYWEQALVPHLTVRAGGGDSRIFRQPGQPAANLNRIVRDRDLDAFATIIENQLPAFAETRKGGFPGDYLRCLAAAAIDYADTDSEPTLAADGAVRGIDAMPFLSELFMRFELTKMAQRGGRWYADLTVQPFVEFWNPSNLEIAGSARSTVDIKSPLRGGFAVGTIDEYLRTNTTPKPDEINGLFFTAPLEVALRPNEYRVYRFQEYEIKEIDLGPAARAPDLEFEADANSTWQLEWNGRITDRVPRIDRRAMTLATGADRQQVRCNLPGHSYFSSGFVNNMGDPRIAWFITIPCDANAYPDNASPNRRNVRYGTIFKNNPPYLYGRVLPSEWPDGGHDSRYGSHHNRTSDLMLPDTAPLMTGLVAWSPADGLLAPQRIANRGHFLDASELGHLYDPVMWFQGMSTGREDTGRLADIGFAYGEQPDPRYGGGNTLRIGRPEHERFAYAAKASPPGAHADGDNERFDTRAARLVDLFHCGDPHGDESARTGPLRRIDGHVNVNTASRETLRALLAGRLEQDVALSEATSQPGATSVDAATRPVRFSAPPGGDDNAEAGLVADAILAERARLGAFQALSQLAGVRDAQGRLVFGNPALHDKARPALRWSDAGAEELFARLHASATLRSRHFRVHATGLVVNKASGKVLARRSRMATLFIDPGERLADGAIDPPKVRVETLYQSEL
jgi:type II secretory pathway pseudopilin PulG